MYKIMLAEDEPEVLESMLENINWGEFGFSKPVGCHDGAEALKHITAGFVPDVLITDIRMPIMDGLALSREVREKLPDTLIVILSGHDEFSYAQKALQLQAYDYILKPITPISLQSLLQKLQKELDEKRLGNMQDSIKIVENHFLNRLLKSEIDQKVFEENCARYNLCFVGTHHLAATLDVDPLLPGEEPQTENDINLLRYGIANIVQEILQAQKSLIVFQGEDKKIYLLVSAPSPEECEALAQTALALAKENISLYLKSSFSVGVGSVVSSANKLHISAKQAIVLLSYRFYSGPASVLQQKNMQMASAEKINFAALEELFDTAMQNFNYNLAFELVDGLFAQMKEAYTPFEMCLKYCQRLVTRLLTFTASFMEESEVETLEHAFEQHSLYSSSFLSHMQLLVRQFLHQVFDVHSLFCNDTSSLQIMRAESYILQKFSNPKLSLQMITDYLSLSTSHFSAIFKAKTGSTFVEYLTKTRMQKAKQMLTHTDSRTYEIAEEIGYSDPQYFSATFKKATGMTPREYREHSRSDIV